MIEKKKTKKKQAGQANTLPRPPPLAQGLDFPLSHSEEVIAGYLDSIKLTILATWTYLNA